VSLEAPGAADGHPRQSTAIQQGQTASTATTMTQPTDSRSTDISVVAWVFSPNHGESVRILDAQTVWNHTFCRVWVPSRKAVE
jgi:hypothetical protein